MIGGPVSRTLGNLLAEQAARTPDALAVHYGGRACSYAQLHERAQRAADGLRVLGVRRGDRLGVLLGNSLEWLDIFFAGLMLGEIGRAHV